MTKKNQAQTHMYEKITELPVEFFRATKKEKKDKMYIRKKN
jgi:hypothetical protein